MKPVHHHCVTCGMAVAKPGWHQVGDREPHCELRGCPWCVNCYDARQPK